MEREGFNEYIENLPDDVEIFYADESGFEEDYSHTYGYAPRGERVFGEVYGTHFGRTSIVSALDADNKLIAPFSFKGYMNGGLFEGWLEQIFVPCLKNPRKSILVIDNATHHRKDLIYEIADNHKFTVVFLPKYSPDLNPIEKIWACVKNWLRLHLHNFDSFENGLIHAFIGR